MGAPMVERLLDFGHPVGVWNRTRERCDAAVARGAVAAGSIAELAQGCELIGICLADGDAVEAVANGPDGLLVTSAPRMRAVLDFSTIDPGRTAALSEQARALGIDWIDCPVSGGVPAARAGTLVGFAGATEEMLPRLRPLTDPLFAKVTPMGGPGAGQLAKLCNQWIVASNLLVIAEALAAARALGLDAWRLPEALAGGFADSKPLQIFGPRMLSHTVEPRMGAIRLMRKDVQLALKAGTLAGAALPSLRHAAQLYDRIAETAGMSLDDDISSLIRLFEPPPPTERFA
jgi:3-hydroxyisobutyrate dehydrogenase